MKKNTFVITSFLLTIFSNIQVTSADMPTSIVAQASKEIPLQICGESKTWVRPSATEQKQHLQEMASRFSPEVVKQLGGKYWKHNIFSFTSYPGGSGTFEIKHLSGLWKNPNPTRPSTCDKSLTELNSGKIARIYVLLHQVTKVSWQGNYYVMVVKPTGRGAQIINLPRRESQKILPLKVVNEKGKEVAVLIN
ncbi:MAG: hypothetical protein ACHBN1_15870 [Heteroscytonema crispum UTEX LB 1556]